MDTLEQEKVVVDTSDGNHDKFSHYVRKQAILQAAIDGVPATALCGKQWLPSESPEKYPVCPSCKEIYEDNERLMGSDL